MGNSCYDHFNSSPAVVCADSRSRTFTVRDYDLKATLTSGQAFRWRPQAGSWVGVIGRRWIRLQSTRTSLLAEATGPIEDWTWLTHYLQLDLELNAVLATFPADEPLQKAVAACHGLRLLRQDPWECLASFILSSTKQILQIQQIISLLCVRYGQALETPAGYEPAYAFPTSERLASLDESDLRACKMGFRAPFLLGAARAVAEGKLDLASLHELPLEIARSKLLALAGVGNKISDCVLLFAFGHQGAFPVDVWIMKALRQFYFEHRKVTLRQLQEFAATHFGTNAGYAQQYLFHYARLRMKRRQIAT